MGPFLKKGPLARRCAYLFGNTYYFEVFCFSINMPPSFVFSVLGFPYGTNQSILMVFCGPHLPLCSFQFVRDPPSTRTANKLEVKWKVAPPQAAAGYSTNSSFCLHGPL